MLLNQTLIKLELPSIKLYVLLFKVMCMCSLADYKHDELVGCAILKPCAVILKSDNQTLQSKTQRCYVGLCYDGWKWY